MESKILSKVQQLIENIHCCDSCLGRQFGNLLSGLSNTKRGEALKILLLMEWENNHWEADIRTAHYCIDEINDAYVKTGFLKEGGPVARSFLHGINTGRDMTAMFLRFLYQLAYKEGYRNFEVVPDEILELAEKEWDWDKFTKEKRYYR